MGDQFYKIMYTSPRDTQNTEKKGREMKRIETNKRGDVKILNDTNTHKFSETIFFKKKGKKHWPFFFMVWYYVYREREISK